MKIHDMKRMEDMVDTGIPGFVYERLKEQEMENPKSKNPDPDIDEVDADGVPNRQL